MLRFLLPSGRGCWGGTIVGVAGLGRLRPQHVGGTVFLSCGSCPEPEGEWKIRVTPYGVTDLGRRQLVPELELVDTLYYRIQRRRATNDVAAPRVAGELNGSRGCCIRGIPTSDAGGPAPKRPCRLDGSPICGLASPMPRGRRRDAPGVLHHVIARGLERRAIFGHDRDRAAAGTWDPLLKHT